MYPFTRVTTSSSASAVVAGGKHYTTFVLLSQKKEDIFLAENVVETKMRQNQVCVKAVMYKSF